MKITYMVLWKDWLVWQHLRSHTNDTMPQNSWQWGEHCTFLTPSSGKWGYRTMGSCNGWNIGGHYLNLLPSGGISPHHLYKYTDTLGDRLAYACQLSTTRHHTSLYVFIQKTECWHFTWFLCAQPWSMHLALFQFLFISFLWRVLIVSPTLQ